VNRIYEGGCSCGKVRFKASVEPVTVCYCHCASCRHASGSAYVPWASFPKSQFTFSGESPRRFASSPGVIRTFCRDCGSPLTYEQTNDDGIDAALCVFDDPAQLTPTHHIWVADKLPWIIIGDELPQYVEWKDNGAD
jgi:hypothetical protein